LSARHFRGVHPDVPVWARLARARRHPIRYGRVLRKGAAMLMADLAGIEPRILLRSESLRTRRRLFGVGTLIVAAALAIVLAITYANRAAESDRAKIAEQLLANATDHAGRLDTALLLTGQAYLTAPDSAARNRLMDLGGELRAVADPAEPEVRRRLRLRMRRQELLTAESPTQLWLVVPQQVLEAPVGGPGVMRGQLAHLLDVAKLPNVELQVIPRNVVPYSALHGAFTIMSFPVPNDAGLVYVETRVRGLFFEEPNELREYAQVMNHLRVQASPPEESSRLIDRIRKEIE
jgi:hypothetical protein